MKEKLISGLILLLIFFAALPYSAGATGENLLSTSSGNVFGGGENFTINQNISRDLVIAGSRLEINGNTGDDFIGAGGELIVNGDVSGNVIAMGGSIRINGNVGGDVVAAGGEISLSRDSVVKGDVLLGGGEITLDGTVNGNGNISAGTLKTGDGFKLKGNLALQADNYPSNLKNKVGGNLNITQTDATEKQSGKPFEDFDIFSFILKLLSAIALGFILIYLFPGFVGGLAGLIKDSPLKAGLLGFLTLVFLPILAIILLITIFGWSLSFLIILFLALALLIATVPVKLLAGEMIYRKILRRDAGKMMYYLIGAVIFGIIFEIPLAGGIIRFIALLTGLGAIVIWLENRARPAS
jgi:hypothetical protein